MKFSSFDATHIMPVTSNSNDVKSGNIRLSAYLSASLFLSQAQYSNCPQMQLKGKHKRFYITHNFVSPSNLKFTVLNWVILP